MSSLQATSRIAEELIKIYNKDPNSINPASIETMIKRICSSLKINSLPRHVDILASIPTNMKGLISLLKCKPTRTISGVCVVAVMCKPHRCPHIALTGNVCIYCPGGVDSDFEYSTQSYTGYEPTSMRAIRARYDPREQVISRIKQFKQLGHSVEKVEIIIMGGTFMSLPRSYRDGFIKELYDGLSNNHSSSLEEAQMVNEKSKSRMVGLTIETRPDFALKPHIKDLLRYGCTRIEIGVQSVYEDVALNTNRGHTILSTRATFCLLKDSGYKIVTHLMPNLPEVDRYRDMAQFKEFFESPGYRSDGLKIYPTLVIRGTGLYELFVNGQYSNYSPDFLIEFLAKVLSLIPPWTRVYRIQRDIPMPLVTSGVEHGNLRELVMLKMSEYNLKCRDVRSREVGINSLKGVKVEEVGLVRRDYYSNEGWETFLSFECVRNDLLLGMCRLRKLGRDAFVNTLDNPFKKELTFPELEVSQIPIGLQKSKKIPFIKIHPDLVNNKCSMVRELHVYGTAAPLNKSDGAQIQHQGFGSLLMREAESISKSEHLSGKVSVISGVGVRGYYRGLGYERDGCYMAKSV